MKKTENKKTLLKGQGTNQHTLYGDLLINQTISDFEPIIVKSQSILKHEKPNGQFSNEHKPLIVSKGEWLMGKQVEYNPMKKTISQIWD